MDESMEPGTSRSDPNIDLPGAMEKRKKGLEKWREQRNQKKQNYEKLAENFRKVPLNVGMSPWSPAHRALTPTLIYQL
uniref:Oxysterol-binding protein-related protein 5 n=1 Tax=Bursaphelenchus xylophilus TaxID=6326 RepID=A0A1I7SK25_BURXY